MLQAPEQHRRRRRSRCRYRTGGVMRPRRPGVAAPSPTRSSATWRPGRQVRSSGGSVASAVGATPDRLVGATGKERLVFVRVVRFTDVSAERIEGLLARIREADGPPPGVPTTGLRFLLDEAQGTAVSLQFYATAEDMAAGADIGRHGCWRDAGHARLRGCLRDQARARFRLRALAGARPEGPGHGSTHGELFARRVLRGRCRPTQAWSAAICVSP